MRPLLFLVLLAGCANAGAVESAANQDGGADAVTIAFDAGPDGTACTGLRCQQTCATTSISGTVYDPAGSVGLYNVLVYVPNAPLDPIADGPTCAQCQAPASGDPVAFTTTDANGRFTLPDAPVGTNIPLVLQVGKWRRHLTVPSVASCVDNPQPDHSLRLPRKQHETSPDDNIPLIAMTTGCDGVECFFLRRIGIDESEFTDATGTGRVRVYTSTSPNIPNAFAGVTSSAWSLWLNDGEMLKYDLVFNACECNTYDRGGAGTSNVGYEHFREYLDAGGRAFTTHYYYNMFANQTQCGGSDATCQGQDPLPGVGAWEGNTNQPVATGCPNAGQGGTCLAIDTGVPKGKAFADWYAANSPALAVGGGESYGHVGLVDVRQDMGKLSSALTGAGTATPWLYAGDVNSDYDAYYFSFNTPVGTTAASQCGRAVFSDVHVAESPVGTFPNYCASDADHSDHAPNELALEFLFFDLTSCVQDDTQPPATPR